MNKLDAVDAVDAAKGGYEAEWKTHGRKGRWEELFKNAGTYVHTYSLHSTDPKLVRNDCTMWNKA
jgi:hypothetical protein